MNLTSLVIFFSTLITRASAQNHWKKECVDGFELLFFKQLKTYNSAKSSCEALGGYLAKVDIERMTTVINSAFDIQGGENTFYIGGNDIANEGYWRWQDGTDVIMREETGYQNWKSNQPNNVGNEDCLAVGRQTYKWVDISCDENFYYICQKVFQGPFVRIQTINVNQRMCSATDCSTATQFEWHKASIKVSTATTSRVYQTLQNGSAILNLQNANIADAGSYSCYFRNGNSWKLGETESYGVAGNPTIQQISNNVCNSNLIISWQPHTNAVGFPHKIEVSPTSGESTRWLDSPTPKKQSTTLTNLSPTTTFQIKITACVTKDNCPTKYSTIRSARTVGSTLSVESSSIIQYKNTQTCVISWILYNKTETGDSYTVELNLTSTLASSRDLNLKTDMKLINVTSSSVYSFQPEPNRNYSVSIKIFKCAGLGQELLVAGTCLGKPTAPAKIFPPESFEDNLINVCGIKKLAIQAPDETNGLVSCIFVLVHTNLKELDDDFSMTDMININNTVSGDEYIAKAIPMTSMNWERMNITLGEESMTTCDVINTGKAEIQNEQSRGKEILFTGRNKKLDKKTFSVSIVYSTPSGDQIHFSQSPSITLKQGEQETTAKNDTEKGAFDFNIISFVIGFLIPFVFLVVSVWIIYKLKKEIKNLKEKAEVKEHNYETIKEKATPPNNPASQPSYSNVLQETAGYEQVLPATTKQTQVESAYEQPSSSNVLQETAGYEQALPATTKQTQVETAYESYNA